MAKKPTDETRTQDPEGRKLPVTAELGDEGGSYGDAAAQAETFQGEQGNPRVDPKRAGPTAEATAPGGSDNERTDAGDMLKHATEPPARSRR